MSTPPLSEFREAYLKGQSRRFESLPQFVENYDLLLTASSWDARCLCLSKANDFRATFALSVFPTSRDNRGLREAHDAALLGFLDRQCRKVIPVEDDSRRVGAIWGRIRNEIRTIVSTIRRPMKVLLDISACPRYVSLATFGMLLTEGLASRISLFYSEASYSGSSSPADIVFTGGRWSVVPVPYYLGETIGDKGKHYLISTGFEGTKTLRAVNQAEPDRVSLLVPYPGFTDVYTLRNANENRNLREEFVIPDSQVVSAPAGDCIAAWKGLAEGRVERPDVENSYYLCCGTKAHSFALALRALCIGFPALMYVIPDEHKVVETKPSGAYWLFAIEDLSAI
jgi:hypothetical protein